jgi:hypothetical protein
VACWLLLAWAGVCACSGARDRHIDRPPSLVSGDRRQSPSRRASAERPREDEEKSVFAADRLHVGEASERARREHTNEHSAQGLTVDGYPHPACAPLTASERRACPLLAVAWTSLKLVPGGVELAASSVRHPDRLHRMVVCHVAFGREHATRQCPLHVPGTQAAIRVGPGGVSLSILAREPAQTAELQRRVKQVVKLQR